MIKKKDGLIYHYEYVPFPLSFGIAYFVICLSSFILGFLITDPILFFGGFLGMGLSSFISHKELISISRDLDTFFDDPKVKKQLKQLRNRED